MIKTDFVTQPSAFGFAGGRLALEARIKVCGIPKGEYFIKSLLYQRIEISVGKYKSDRLALELKKLREAFECAKSETATLCECKALLKQLREIMADNEKISADDFKTIT